MWCIFVQRITTRIMKYVVKMKRRCPTSANRVGNATDILFGAYEGHGGLGGCKP